MYLAIQMKLNKQSLIMVSRPPKQNKEKSELEQFLTICKVKTP